MDIFEIEIFPFSIPYISNADNYYMFKFKSNVSAIPSYDIFDDGFTQGNENFGLYNNEDLKSGDNLDLTLYGISKRYFEYMRKLTAVAAGILMLLSIGIVFFNPKKMDDKIANTTATSSTSGNYFVVA